MGIFRLDGSVILKGIRAESNGGTYLYILVIKRRLRNICSAKTVFREKKT